MPLQVGKRFIVRGVISGCGWGPLDFLRFSAKPTHNGQSIFYSKTLLLEWLLTPAAQLADIMEHSAGMNAARAREIRLELQTGCRLSAHNAMGEVEEAAVNTRYKVRPITTSCGNGYRLSSTTFATIRSLARYVNLGGSPHREMDLNTQCAIRETCPISPTTPSSSSCCCGASSSSSDSSGPRGRCDGKHRTQLDLVYKVLRLRLGKRPY